MDYKYERFELKHLKEALNNQNLIGFCLKVQSTPVTTTA
jgi:hypothetical protein